MKVTLSILAVVWAVILLAALGQTTVDPQPSETPTPTPPPRAQGTEVLTPGQQGQVDEAGQPLTPMSPGFAPQTESQTLMQTETQPIEGAPLEGEAAVDLTGRKRWRIIPLFSAGVAYDDNIFLSNTDRVSDVIWTTSAGLIFELGDFRNRQENYLSLQWIGQPVIYTENPAQNAFNQFAALGFQYRFSKLVMALNSNYSIVKGPNRDVNTITTQQSLWNTLAFAYDYSDKTQLNLTFAQNSQITEGFQTTSQYEVRAGANYQIFPKTRVGFQGSVGVIDSSDTPLQYFQQARLQVSYAGTEKLNFTANVGVQVLEFEGSDITKIDPVFSLGVNYQPFPSTSIGLIGFRNVVGSSSLAGQDYFATGFELRVQQQFFQKFVAAVALGYENDSYFGTTPETASTTNRVDNYVYVSPRLTYAFVDWVSVSIFYDFRQTSSTEQASSFYNNRAGLELFVKF